MDSRVVKNHTQRNRITTLSLRHDGWIYDTAANVKKYYEEYLPFLQAQANALNQAKVAFADFDAYGNQFAATWRPCDIEMALF